MLSFKTCSQCNTKKDISEFRKWRRRCKECTKKYRRESYERLETYKKNKEKLKNAPSHSKEYARAWREKFKKQVFDHYGPCACCGEATLAFLTIDHIEEDGATFRKQIAGGYDTYKYIIQNNFPKDLRTLCWNCNCARRFTKVCPHQIVNNQSHVEPIDPVNASPLL